jgi:hypothetical protein
MQHGRPTFGSPVAGGVAPGAYPATADTPFAIRGSPMASAAHPSLGSDPRSVPGGHTPLMNGGQAGRQVSDPCVVLCVEMGLTGITLGWQRGCAASAAPAVKVPAWQESEWQRHKGGYFGPFQLPSGSGNLLNMHHHWLATQQPASRCCHGLNSLQRITCKHPRSCASDTFLPHVLSHS